MKKLEQKIEDILGANCIYGQKIALYGCSNETSILLEVIKNANLGMEVLFILDSDRRKDHSFYEGIEVRFPCETILRNADVSIIIWSLYADKMIKNVSRYVLSEKQIIHIDIRRDSKLYLEYQINKTKRALEYYESIREKPSQYCLLAPIASGDTYIALAFLNEWKHKNGVQDVLLIGSGKNLKHVAELYEIENVVIIDEKAKRDLEFLSSVLGEQIKLKMLSPWEFKLRNSFFPFGESKFPFVDKYRYEVFGLDKKSCPVYPSMSGNVVEQTRKAIFAPYAYSSPTPRISKEIWRDIAVEIANRGYRVFTVGYGEKEPPIEGTKLIQFTYKEIPHIFGENDLFIAGRSGLCDIIHNSPCNKIILFGNTRNKYAMDLFSMRKNYSDFRGEELLVSNLSGSEIVEKVIKILNI